MRNIYKFALLAVLTLGISACDFDTDNYQQIPAEGAYSSVQDVQNGMNGAYYALGSYQFLGNYATSFGDFAAGISSGSATSGHMYDISTFGISETSSEIRDIWNYGFKVVDRTTRTIRGGKDILVKAETLHLSDKEIANLNSYIAQSYALKALANYYLVNIFALPYEVNGLNSQLGLPLVKDEPINAFEKIDRSTVAETYKLIDDDIKNAENFMKTALEFQDDYGKQLIPTPSAYYMGPMGIQALKARVYMSMGKYNEAANAAKAALTAKGKGDGTDTDETPSNETYINMWSSLSISDEDLFTIAKTEADNLSANALNTLYGSYGGTLNAAPLELYAENDIRTGLIGSNEEGDTTTKFAGIPTNASVNNIPIFRKSEMSLIIAEVEARNNNIDAAKKYLFFTAKRDLDLTIDELPDTQGDLLTFISEERIREFIAEGHRFYDSRRMREVVNIDKFDPFDIAKFVFPIPADEINAGFCTQQNIGWEDYLPVQANN